jgi:hypothetical protein
MKKLILASSIFALALFSCKKDKETVTNNTNTNNNTPTWEAGDYKSDMMVFLNANAPAFNAYTVNAATGGTFTNDSITITIPANVFVNANGSSYSGTINLKMQTIRGIEDMIYSGITTLAGNGELLISDGMFKLEAYDESNNKLKLKQGSTIVVSFPDFAPGNMAFKGTETPGVNKIEWNVWDSVDIKQGGAASTFLVGLDSIFKYVNLDRMMNETPLTDITVTIPLGFTNKNADCFIKYVGEDAAAFLPSKNNIKAFTTLGGNYKVVQNRAAKIICMAKKDGKFYYQVKNISAIAANQTMAMDNLVETTENNLRAVIASF